MKKFDFFLILVAVCLIGVGYYFAKEFKPETNSAQDDIHHNEGDEAKVKPSLRKRFQIPSVPHRLPSGNKDKQQEQKTPPAENPSQTFHKRYLELKNCLKTEACDFSHEDPRAYELGVFKSINDHLADVSQLPSDYLEILLKDAVKIPDGFVKKTVLKHLKDKGIYSHAWRDIVLVEYVGFHDAHLIPEAMEYLKANMNEQDRALAHNKFLHEIAHGSPMVANALVENIKSLLDASSVQYYKQEISRMSDGPIKENLQREIRDYELESSAG